RLSARFGRPVVVAEEPDLAVVRGAAELALRIAAPPPAPSPREAVPDPDPAAAPPGPAAEGEPGPVAKEPAPAAGEPGVVVVVPAGDALVQSPDRLPDFNETRNLFLEDE